MPKPPPFLASCACGRPHAAGPACDAPPPRDGTGALGSAVQEAVLRATFPRAGVRRAMLRAFGAGTLLAAIDRILPIAGARQAMAQPVAPEKKALKIGFIPITCATPIIMAHPMGFYSRQGLEVEVVRTAGWAVIRDKALAREYDAAHMLAPMPLALTMGAGATATPWTVAAIENINGQAITLANKHKDKRDPKSWRGFRFGVPFDYSMHNYLLRYYLAEHGLHPDRDVQIRAVPPPEMVANLRADNIDGFLGPDPFNQRAVYDGIGFIHLLTRELWDGHPCCAFTASRAMLREAPNSFAAMLRAIVEATAHAQKAENRKEVAAAISGAAYLNQPPIVVEQVLTGTFADGLGAVQRVPERIGFDPYPYQSMAVWIMTQMKRWGQVKGDLDYRGIAEQVFLATDAARVMRDQGLAVPAESYRSHTIMGRRFDPAEPETYLRSLPLANG